MSANEDDDAAAPDGRVDYLLRELVEVRADMAVLRAVADAQGHLLQALAVALPASRRRGAIALLRERQTMLSLDGQAPAAAMLGVALEGLLGLLGPDAARPMGEVAAAEGLANALVQGVPAAHARPMRSWLGMATPAELAQDAAQLPPERLAELLRQQGAAGPARRGGAARAKKRPKGD